MESRVGLESSVTKVYILIIRDLFETKSSACITGVILSSAKHETTSAQLAQLEECRSAERKAVSFNLGRTTNH